MEQNPKVTVLMPVFNGEKYLREAIESILDQTYTDFEFLIINDGSTDNSVKIIESYDDPRIRLVHNKKNLKLIATLNRGLDLAKGEYIARMDCDDVSLPERLEKQIEFMDKNPQVGVCGSWVETIGLTEGEIWRHPLEPEEIAAKLFFQNAFAHPTVMMRTSFFRENNLHYDPEYIHAEDFALWQRCRYLFPMANIPLVLLKYRIVSSSITRVYWDEMQKTLGKIYAENLQALKIEMTIQNSTLYQKISSLKVDINEISLLEAEKFLALLDEKNKSLNIYPKPNFSRAVAYFWYLNCNTASSLGFKAWRLFWQSSLSKYRELTRLERIKFFIKCLIKEKGNALD